MTPRLAKKVPDDRPIPAIRDDLLSWTDRHATGRAAMKKEA